MLGHPSTGSRRPSCRAFHPPRQNYSSALAHSPPQFVLVPKVSTLQRAAREVSLELRPKKPQLFVLCASLLAHRSNIHYFPLDQSSNELHSTQPNNFSNIIQINITSSCVNSTKRLISRKLHNSKGLIKTFQSLFHSFIQPF